MECGHWQADRHDLTDPDSNPTVSSVAFSPDGKIVATADLNGGAYLWDVATGQRIATLAGPSGLGVYGVAFSPDGKIVATANLNGVTYLWGIATGRTRR